MNRERKTGIGDGCQGKQNEGELKCIQHGGEEEGETGRDEEDKERGRDGGGGREEGGRGRMK